MKRWRVVIPPVVEEQIRAQLLYIAEDSIDNALAWEDRLHSAIQNIGRMPGGHVVDESASKRVGETVHKMVFEKTYLIHFRLKANTAIVEIVNFRHGARLPRNKEP